jgi:hypothetical protein
VSITCGAIGGPVVEFDTRTMYLNHHDPIGSNQGSRRDFRDIVDHLRRRISPLFAIINRLSEIAKARTDCMKKIMSANRSSRPMKIDLSKACLGRRGRTST